MREPGSMPMGVCAMVWCGIGGALDCEKGGIIPYTLGNIIPGMPAA